MDKIMGTSLLKFNVRRHEPSRPRWQQGVVCLGDEHQATVAGGPHGSHCEAG